MVQKILKATEDKTRKQNKNIQLFDVALKPINNSSSQSYTNCYCYGPAYPPCCP